MMSNFEQDLAQSKKTVAFISSFLLNEGLLNFIDIREPSESCVHPPDIKIHLEPTIYIEVKEDAMSMKTGNIYLEHRALKEFSLVCVDESALPLLMIVPYVNPRPLLFFLSDEFRQELIQGLKEGIVRVVNGGDHGGLGYIITEKNARLMTSCVTGQFFTDSQLDEFEEKFINEFFHSENHFFMKYVDFQ